MLDFIIKYQVAFYILSILLAATIVSSIAKSIVRRYLESESIKLKSDYSKYKFLSYAITSIIWVVAIATIVWLNPRLRSLATTLFAGAGLLLVFIGVAAQTAFSNLVGGLFIVMFKPFKIGDMIKVGSLDQGIVVDITLRHTVIRNLENNHIIIPNSNISSDVLINNTAIDPEVCRHIEIGISYDSDLKHAITIIQQEAQQHANTLDKRSDEDLAKGVPYCQVRLMSYGDSSINLRAFVWVDNFKNGIAVQSDLLQNIKQRFDAEGIEIPFPYRTLVFKKDLDSPIEQVVE